MNYQSIPPGFTELYTKSGYKLPFSAEEVIDFNIVGKIVDVRNHINSKELKSLKFPNINDLTLIDMSPLGKHVPADVEISLEECIAFKNMHSKDSSKYPEIPHNSSMAAYIEDLMKLSGFFDHIGKKNMF